VAALLLLLSAVGMAVALTLPTIWYQTIGYPEEVFSILGGIRALWQDGTPVLSVVVFAFSIVLPLFKLVVSGCVAIRGAATARSASMLRWLHAAGRWSTLDFWVVGLFVSAVQLGVTRSETRPGIHLFMLAMIAGILATRILAGALPAAAPPRATWAPPRNPALGRAVHLASILCLAVAPPLLLLSVEKGILLKHDLSLASAVAERAGDGEWWLALGLVTWMLLVPAARALAAGIGHWSAGPPGRRVFRLERELSRWSMLDVLLLALFIVTSKLDDLATIELGAGASALAGAAIFGALDSALLRQRGRSASGANDVSG
jgi:paraquat-inducible protein A